MILIYPIVFVLLIVFILLFTRKLVWVFVKKDKMEKAEKVHNFNKVFYGFWVQKAALTRDIFMHFLPVAGKNKVYNVANTCFWVVVDEGLKKYDSSSLIQKKIGIEIDKSLQFIDDLISNSNYPEIVEVLQDLQKDILDRKLTFQNVREISELYDILQFIKDIRQDAEELSQMTEEEIYGTSQTNYYDTFGIKSDASFSEIKKAYRKLAKLYHPDINKDSDADLIFKKINLIYQTLSNPKKREEYDISLKV